LDGWKRCTESTFFKVSSQNYPKWFYYFWTKHYLPEFRRIAQDKATTMGHIQRRHLSESRSIIPEDKILDKMSKTMNPIIEEIINLKIESRHLAKVRDSLLPKLMSGEIRVK
jgi:type I restriction enzyme S subunit